MKLFIRNVAIETVVLIIIGLFPFLAWWTQYSRELLIAFVISLLNAAVGYHIAVRFFNEKAVVFNKFVYGGMLVRMIFLIGFALYMISREYVQTVPFFIALMFFYILHQWTEITSWLKVLPNQKAGITA